MNTCDCYRLKEQTSYCNNTFNTDVGICQGTKELDECSCEGDSARCDFYPEIRKKATREKIGKELSTKIADIIIALNSIETSNLSDESIKQNIINELFNIKFDLAKLLEKEAT